MDDPVSLARVFVDDWLHMAVATGRATDPSNAEDYALTCHEDAEKSGIPRAAIDKAVGNLAGYISAEMQRAIDKK